MKKIKKTSKKKLFSWSFAFYIVISTIVLCELMARAIIYIRWSDSRIEYYTKISSDRFKYSSHQNLPYILSPNYGEQNSLGFRGKNISPRKEPGVFRVAVLGASTTYGIYVSPENTYAAQLERMLAKKLKKVEVINAGVPGWISTDSLINLQLRILPLRPDLIIVYQGRNELFPQSFNNYQADYSHFRVSDHSFTYTNYLQKKLFKISHFAMFATHHGLNLFGWSRKKEGLYGVIRYENQPTDGEIIKNLSDPVRNETFRETLRSMVSISQARNIKVLLATFAFRAEQFATRVLNVKEKNHKKNDNDPMVYVALQKQMQENNQIVREIAREYEIPVAETATLTSNPELFHDDCHFNAEGHYRRAEILFDAIMKHGLVKP